MSTDDIIDIVEAGLLRTAGTMREVIKKAWATNTSGPTKTEPETLSADLRSYTARAVNAELRQLRDRIFGLLGGQDDVTRARHMDVAEALIAYRRDSVMHALFRYMKYHLEGYVARYDETYMAKRFDRHSPTETSGEH